MLVFAFDRDWTVDVNPHPHHEAVPLKWVRHLAHETDHAVYAIGNQTLAEEAAIPGVVDIVGRHPDDWDEWLGAKQSDGHYEQFPLRRERLSLIADLHPNADGYIVVDDLDLGDVQEWEHYHAWEFVPAVRQGDIHPDLPWVSEVATDGGFPTTAGVVPTDVSMLSSFLDDNSEAPAYELTYTEDGETRQRLCLKVSLNKVRLECPEKRPAVHCTPLDPSLDGFIVPFEDIERLSAVEPPSESYTSGAQTPAQEAEGLCRLAERRPEAVRLSAVLTLLDSEETNQKRDRRALRALRYLAGDRPDECTPAVPILRSLLTREEGPKAADSLITLRRIATVDPEAVVSAADEIIPYLESAIVTEHREAARCLAELADEHPDDVVDGVVGFQEMIEGRSRGYESAVKALALVAREHPEAVGQTAETLADVSLDESEPEDVRLHATAALGRTVSKQPDLAVGIVDDLAALLETDNPKLRNNAMGLLCDVATIHNDLVEPYAEDITALLTVEDTYTRINATAALSRIAQDFPESVTDAIPTFIELLSDEDARVRENVCWGLGYLHAEDAKAALEERLHEEENRDVRTRAEWALARISHE